MSPEDRILKVGLIVSAAVLIAQSSASAHALSVSYAQLAIQNRRVDAVLRMPLDDLDLLLRLDTDLDGHVSDAEIARARPAIQHYIQSHLDVRADRVPLAVEVTRLAL